ncbi:MAG TPA: metal ABC transporter permease [Candidatus Babeliales bacterium]|nr:metal ABC transporter permease [Candidatus Babeliales bacterium]
MICFFDYTLLLVLQGAALLGITAGALGSFALLRQQSLLGDAISHAALPGIVLMFLCTHSKNPWILLSGGALAGIVGVISMHYVCTRTTLKKDAVLGIILSVFFGLGLVLMTVAQKIPTSNQAILNKFLFGNVATLMQQDIIAIAIISFFIMTILVWCWKECAMYVFDPVFTHSLGFKPIIIETILTVLLVLTIVIGLQTVGVVLMSTMLIAPAAAARQWVNKLMHMVLLSSLFGCATTVISVYASSIIDHLPTGPAIVVAASCIVFFSLVCAPQRGVAWR